MSVIESIITHEGFKSKPYPDPINGWGTPTFGHGLTTITPEESRQLVENRVTAIMHQLDQRLTGYRNLPNAAQDILIEMAYQLGIAGLLKFKRMLYSLRGGDYANAATEMLNSQWAKQTPNRAHTLAKRMQSLGEPS